MSQETIPEKTVMDLAEAFCDAMFAPTPYSGVWMLRRAADFCSNLMMANAHNWQECLNWGNAAQLLCDKADELDTELVNAEPANEAVCGNCGATYGEHEHNDAACPTDESFSKTLTFAEVR